MEHPKAPLISLRHVEKSFKDGRLLVLEDITFDVGPGEFVSLVGPSGCGKTTLLRLMNGLIKPDRGEILVKGKPPSPTSDMAMVFQSARLLPWRTVAGNIEFVLALRGLSRRARAERALALLGAVGLRDFADAYPHELSGGMQQRVGLARALAVEPEVLLMDEPFAALDAQTRIILQEELLRIWGQTGDRAERRTVVFITHAIDEAVFLSDRVVVMSAHPGRIIEILDVDLPRPRTDATRTRPEFQALSQAIWNLIRDEVYRAATAAGSAGGARG
ncbi:MAG: ABC transporter ATP-binding protein [Geminicoccaceae bacterium]|nr:ABC transporter ATP-binding protein [Geminicoccaceae bacterium]